jgi:hypothetical protein
MVFIKSMKLSRFRFSALFAAFLLLLAQSSFGQSTRTWVSGVGDDANPASRTAPAKTFAGAISKTTSPGEIDALDPGGFGAVTITQSVTIDGGPGVAGVLVEGTPGITISSTASTPIVVTLRNLDINGLGSGTAGIQVNSPVILYVENCQIYGFTGHGISFAPSAGTAALFVHNTHIHDCGGDGVFLSPGSAAIAQIKDSQIEDCAVGVHGGVNSVTVVHGSSALGNAGAGFETVAGATMSIENSEASLNDTGISSAGKISITNVTVSNNSTVGLSHAKGGLIESFHNNPVGALDGLKAEGVPTSYVPLK